MTAKDIDLQDYNFEITCFFWKNRKKGCVLGKENCYYLIEPPKGPSKCEGRPYKRAKPCVLVPCYKDLMTPLEKRGDAK